MFELVSFEAGSSITIRGKRRRPVDSVISYVAADRPPAGSRLLVKYGVKYSSRAVAVPMRLILAPGDLIMMRRQLLDLKRLAEAGAGAGPQVASE